MKQKRIGLLDLADLNALRMVAHRRPPLETAIVNPPQSRGCILKSRLAMKILMALLLTLPLFACERRGELESAGEALDDAGDAIVDTIDDARDDIEDALE